ncbi:helix-turn-helix domain-containing protein [Kitasatospora sp. NPDC048194]|uniref:helix-turn-helix domain-containing protein n=1 Tax=Kitasatospora sp. NPDC048194 TaxID=3364045 RepID=UPI003712C253
MSKLLAKRAVAWLSSLVTPNGTAIRALRTACNVSLRELALRTGRDRSHLSRVERGLAGASEETIRAIAAALGLPNAAALNREEQP